MRKITYICDSCKREYKYELEAVDIDRQPLLKILNKEYCRQCIKKMINNLQ